MNNYENPEFEKPANTQKTSPKRKVTKKRLAGVVGGAALAAAVAFGGGSIINQVPTTYAQTTTQPATPTTGTSTGTGATAAGMPGGKGGDRGGKGGFGGGVSGTISAISGNSLTLTRGSVIVIQATVNSSTVYTKAGQTISLADLKVGQEVSVRTTTATDGTVSVSAVEIVLSRSGGTVSAVDSSSLTLTKADNSTVKVNLSSSTTYSDLGKTVSLADIKSGVKVEVAGTTNSDGSLNAEVVNIQHDRLGGTVTAVSGNTITVQVNGRGGPGMGKPADGTTSATPAAGTGTTSTATTKTITVSDGTVYFESGQTVALSEIAVGSNINAQGTLSSDGNSLTALQVDIQLPHYQGQVTSVNGNTIVITDRAGTARTIEVNSATKYLNGQATAALSDITVGFNISVEGKTDSSGKMTATQVQLGQGQGGPGAGGPGGRGKGGR